MSQISQNVEFVQVNIYLDRELIATEGWCVLEFKRCLDRSCKKNTLRAVRCREVALEAPEL